MNYRIKSNLYLPHEGQKEFHKATRDPKIKELFVLSPVQCGKTYGILFDSLLFTNNTSPKNPVVLVCPTYPLARDTLQTPLITLAADLGILANANRAEHTINLKNGSYLVVKSAENPDTQLRGVVASRVYVDECCFMTEYAIQLLRARLLATNGDLILATTPKGKTNWVYKTYFKKPKPHTTYLYYKLFMNPNHTEEGVENMYASYSKELAKQELEAMWIDNDVGVLYNAITEHNYKHTPDEPLEPKLIVGVDFNLDKNAWIICQRGMNTGRVWCVKEGYGTTTTNDMAKELYKALNTPLPYEIVIDGSGWNRLQGVGTTHEQIMRETGLKNVRRQLNPPRERRYALTNACLENGLGENILMFTQPTHNTFEELQTLTDGDKENHRSDAIGYVLWWLFQNKPPRLNIPQNTQHPLLAKYI